MEEMESPKTKMNFNFSEPTEKLMQKKSVEKGEIMKRLLIVSVVLILNLITWTLTAANRNIEKVGEWGTGPCVKVVTQGKYAYCTASRAGLDIIDISNPAAPQYVAGVQTEGDARDVVVNGNYAYVVNVDQFCVIDISNPKKPVLIWSQYYYGVGKIALSGDKLCIVSSDHMQIFDISIPDSPVYKGRFNDIDNLYISDIEVVGNEAYIAAVDTGESAMFIVDINNPVNPQLAGTYDNPDYSAGGIAVMGNYAYMYGVDKKMVVIDVSDIANPKKMGEYPFEQVVTDLTVNGNYAYLGLQTGGMQVLDISNPANPTNVVHYKENTEYPTIHLSDGRAYLANQDKGLMIIDINTPSSPTTLSILAHYGMYNDIFVEGNIAYVLDSGSGIRILDVSSKESPILQGTWTLNQDGNAEMFDIHAKDNHVLCLDYETGLYIIDATDSTNPQQVAHFQEFDGPPMACCYDGNYGFFITDSDKLNILDLSTPATPVKKCSIKIEDDSIKMVAKGDFLYIDTTKDLMIYNISDPSNPTLVSRIDYKQQIPYGVSQPAIDGNTLYLLEYIVGDKNEYNLQIWDVANPLQPQKKGTKSLDVGFDNIAVHGGYAYMVKANRGITVMNVSDAANVTQVGNYDLFEDITSIDVENDYIYVPSPDIGKIKIFEFLNQQIPVSRLKLDKTSLHFDVHLPAQFPAPQIVNVTFEGQQDLDWSIEWSQYLLLNPQTNKTEGGGTITVSIWTHNLPEPGQYSDTIWVKSPYTVNTSVPIQVTVNVTGNTPTTAPPFGAFETPLEGAAVSGSIPVTGWALDNSGIHYIQIFRENQTDGSLVYIGDATQVEGARPDVAQAYPGYPNNTRAGWGYMLLTNYLPNGGNGTFRLHAVATDYEGNQVNLGTKTIHCDNANAVNPFGTIDTPEQGGIVSGTGYINYGWVLTPQPNTIPVDGKTIDVWIDGVNVGNPVYNQYRSDIAEYFPGYNNSDGAVGYFYIDTTRYDDGVHTIQWTAKDDDGNIDGIGSRFFTIQNSEARQQQQKTVKTIEKKVSDRQHDRRQATRRVTNRSNRMAEAGEFERIPVDEFSTVRFRKGFQVEQEPRLAQTDNNGTTQIRIEELQRLEIHLDENQPTDVKRNWKLVTPLIGSTMDTETGIFYWSPGPGFVGTYRLVFVNTNEFSERMKKIVTVNVTPKTKSNAR
jgi:hypothetical protein